MPVSLVVDDPNLANFLKITELVSRFYASSLTGWSESPFAWILALPSRARGAAGEKIVDAWLMSNGFDVKRARHSGYDRIVNGENMEIKFSTRWKSGGYKFQQLRDQDYAFVFCLGISPSLVHAWLIPKEVAWSTPFLNMAALLEKIQSGSAFRPIAHPLGCLSMGVLCRKL